MATLTIFTNFRINDEERFLRMQDSLRSFKNIDAQKWVINARGSFAEDVGTFLKQELGDKLVFSMLDSGKGWFHDTRTLLDEITTDYVLYWIEDHVNLAPVERYTDILSQLKESNTEFMWYSWWLNGHMVECYDQIPKKEMKDISTFTLDRKTLPLVRETVVMPFIIILLGIFSADLFKKVIRRYSLFMRWHSKWTPFEIEKRPDDLAWLPVRYALPKYELFASIDDDIGCEGYSLQSRGLYPKRMSRPALEDKTEKMAAAEERSKRKFLRKIMPPRVWYNLRKLRNSIRLTLEGN